jgi:uncharacterized membrane protein YbaN (DUF454 family)
MAEGVPEQFTQGPADRFFKDALSSYYERNIKRKAVAIREAGSHPSGSLAPIMPPGIKILPTNWEKPSRMRRHIYLCLGYGSLALGIAGIFLPVLPTTPFVLLAVWCFSRSNPALAERLYSHPRFGILLTTWRDQKAIPLRAKITALSMLALSYGLILWLSDSTVLPYVLAAIMGGVALYITTRPSPREGSTSRKPEV